MSAEKRQVAPVVPNRVQMAEHGRNIWLITAEGGEYQEDFLQPEYYANVAVNMRPMDHVEIRCDDGSFWGEYLVIAADRQWAQVMELRSHRLVQALQQPTDKRFRVEYKGPHLKHSVIRLQDSAVLHEGEQTASGANRWLEDYIRTIGKKAA